MLDGKRVVSKPDGNGANAVSLELQQFADWVLSQPHVIEVAAAVHPISFNVECTSLNPTDGMPEYEPAELDANRECGDSWLLVRVRFPVADPRGGLVSFIPQIEPEVAEQAI